jgi:hypothetical protein
MFALASNRAWTHVCRTAALALVFGCTSDASSANAPTGPNSPSGANGPTAQVAGEGIAAETDARVSVYHRFNQSSGLALAFDSERFDVGGMHDEAVNNSRLTVPSGQGGTYLITFHGRVTDIDLTGAQVQVSITKNGSTTIRVFSTTGEASDVLGLSLAFHEDLLAGDYLQAIVSETVFAEAVTTMGSLANVGFELVRVR